MSVVAANLYRHGEVVGPVSLDSPLLCSADRSRFVWIGLYEPSEGGLRDSRRTTVCIRSPSRTP